MTTNTIMFSINDQEVNLIFNAASLNAMSKVLFGNQSKAFKMDELLMGINKANEENFWFACKIIIYAGIVGNDMESDSPRPKYTFSEVGKLVAKMTEPELMEYTEKVWESFLDQLGMNLEAIKGQEADDSQGEKKK